MGIISIQYYRKTSEGVRERESGEETEREQVREMTEIQRQKQKERHKHREKERRGREKERERGGEIQTHRYPERMIYEDDASQDNPITARSHRGTQGTGSS